MREMMFRGKRADNGEWVEGYFVGAGVCMIIPQDAEHWGGVDFNEGYIVDPETVGRYTGLADKNGKKIFEGDIVECWSEGVCAQGTVQQRKDGMWIIYPAWQKYIMWSLCPDEHMHTTVEVIGNIHDNEEKAGE